MFLKIQILFFLVLSLLVVAPAMAQTDKKKLEAKRNALKKDIKKIKNYLYSTKKKERNISHQVKDLNQKIETRTELINTIIAEIKTMDSEIESNTVLMKDLQDDLVLLKADYGSLIYQSYKNKTKESSLMFILSSDNFYQGYQRFQYMKQYTNYLKTQGDSIKSKAMKFRMLNDSLTVMKNQKQSLIDEKKYEQDQISIEKDEKEVLVKKYRKKKKSYLAQIKRKQRQEKKLAKQIENAIKNAIKKTAPKKGSSNKKEESFALTPAGKALSGKFEANKGKLPWPVKNGLVTERFGTHPDPMDPSLKTSNSGVIIATNKDMRARSVFDGKVLAIQKNPQNGVLYVMIQHGNYISVYANLEESFVSIGESVKTKEEIGIIHTDKITGKTVLKFQIWKNVTKQNPASWVYKL